MATRVTYRQIYVKPTTDEEDRSLVIPHVDSGWCQVVNAEYVGGGGELRFLLHVIIFEPVPEPGSGDEGGPGRTRSG